MGYQDINIEDLFPEYQQRKNAALIAVIVFFTIKVASKYGVSQWALRRALKQSN